jgi:phage terminase large subunit GpA-like protein
MQLAAGRVPFPAFPLLQFVRFTPGERRIFRGRERDPKTNRPLTVSQWIERYGMVVVKGRAVPWSKDRVPYAAGVLDWWNAPSIRKIYLCWAPRTGKTNTAFACLSYSIDQAPGPVMYFMADEKSTRRISRRRIIPMLKGNPRLKRYLGERSEDTTTLHTRLTTGADIMMAWATSAAEMASEEAQYTISDEVDKYPDAPEKIKEADSLAQIDVRVGSFPHTSKQLYITSPSAWPSKIWNRIKAEADIVYCHTAICLICGHEQIMEFENFTWPDRVTDPRTILSKRIGHYSCASCGMKWDDHARNRAVKKGRWLPGYLNEKDEWHPFAPEDVPARPVAVAALQPSWYSPDVSLSQVIADYLHGKNDPEKEILFETRHRARPFRKHLQASTEVQLLQHRTELRSGIVPAAAIALTCGIDVQKIGFWFVVRAWLEDLTSHKIQHGFVSTFADVEKIVFDTRWSIEGKLGLTMPIWRAAMDTGGGKSVNDVWTRTEEIYEWLRKWATHGVVFGTKGASRPQFGNVKVTVVDKMPRSQVPIPGGLELRILATERYKSLLHWRLTRKGEESQRFYLDADTDTDYVKQFLAERPVSTKKGTIWEGRGANHLLDCEVLAAACADAQWVPSLTMLAPKMKELLRDAEARMTTDQPLVAQPRREALTQSTVPPRPEYQRPAWLNR